MIRRLLFVLVCICGFANPAFADVPDVLVSFGAENAREYALVVEKESQQLSVYSCTGKCEEIARFDCSTGRSPGDKTVRGDNKTPDGVYFFIKIHEKKDLGPIYGIRAFVTDYPNFADKTRGKTGSEIWLHGTNKTLKDRDSSGCVVMDDENVIKVSQYITLNRTPIIIAQKLSYAPDPPRTEALAKLVSDWGNALRSGSYHEYLKYYDDEYLPDMTWWLKWNAARKDSVSVGVKPIGIFGYGEGYVAIAEQSAKSGEKETLVGIRKLFLAKKGERFAIVGDEYQDIAVRTNQGEYPLLAGVRLLKAGTASASAAVLPEQGEIEQMLEKWVTAWSSKDIGQYGEFYASDFRSQGMDKTAWLRYKESLNRKYKFIRVSKQDVRIAKEDDSHVKVVFVQSYQSPGLKSVGKKELVLKHERGQWKIFRESSRKK